MRFSPDTLTHNLLIHIYVLYDRAFFVNCGFSLAAYQPSLNTILLCFFGWLRIVHDAMTRTFQKWIDEGKFRATGKQLEVSDLW